MYVRCYPGETKDQALDRAINTMEIISNQRDLKKNECERLKIDLKTRDEAAQKTDATIKSLKSEIKAIREQNFANNISDLPIREKLAAAKAKNIEYQQRILQLSDENKKLKSSKAAEDIINKSLKADNQRLKCQIQKADCTPSAQFQNGTIMKLKVEPTMTIFGEENLDTKKQPLQRKRKALNDITVQAIPVKASYSGSTNILATDALNNSVFDLELTSEVASNKQGCFIFNQKLVFNQKN